LPQHAVGDVGQGGLGGNLLFLPEPEDDAVHQAHPLLDAGLHRVAQAGALVFADETLDGEVVDHDLAGELKAAAVGGEQTLANDAAQALRHAGANLRLLGGGKHVEQPVQRGRGVARVHRADDEVTRLGRADRHLDRFEVAQLADNDDVGILAQRALERGEKRPGVLADLALRNVAALRGLDDLDGILDRDDVVRARLVEEVDERGERGGLAGADGARDEDEPVVVGEQFLDRLDVLAEAELLERQDLGGHHAIRAGGPVLVHHQVHPVAVGGIDREAVVEVLALEKILFFTLGEHHGVEPQRIGGGQGLLREIGQGAVLPDERARSGAQVQVADARPGAAVEQITERAAQLVIVHRGHFLEGEVGQAGGHGGTKRVARRRPGSGLGKSFVERGFETGDIMDDAGVDELLGESDGVGALAELFHERIALREREEALPGPEGRQPLNVRTDSHWLPSLRVAPAPASANHAPRHLPATGITPARPARHRMTPQLRPAGRECPRKLNQPQPVLAGGNFSACSYRTSLRTQAVMASSSSSGRNGFSRYSAAPAAIPRRMD
jgi:hypothetical protein